MSSGENDSPVDERTSAGVHPGGFSVQFVVPQYGDGPWVLTEVGLVVQVTGYPEADTGGVAITAALGHVGSLDTGIGFLGWFGWFVLTLVGILRNSVVTGFFHLRGKAAHLQVVLALTSRPESDIRFFDSRISRF